MCCSCDHPYPNAPIQPYCTAHLMSARTRLLSNDNDSDLLEISGIYTTGGKESCARWLTHRHKTAPRTKARGGIGPIFVLEEIRGVCVSLLAPDAAPCHRSALNGRAAYWYSAAAAQVSEKAEPLNILTAFCSVSRGQAPFTRAF